MGLLIRGACVCRRTILPRTFPLGGSFGGAAGALAGESSSEASGFACAKVWCMHAGMPPDRKCGPPQSRPFSVHDSRSSRFLRAAVYRRGSLPASAANPAWQPSEVLLPQYVHLKFRVPQLLSHAPSGSMNSMWAFIDSSAASRTSESFAASAYPTSDGRVSSTL